MNTCHFAIALITTAAFSPFIAQASPEMESVNICARALAASLAAPGAAAPAYKLVYLRNRFTGSVADYFPANAFDLEAHDPKTGKVIARARCSTNYRGAIVAFSRVRSGEESATLSAQR